MSHLRRLAQPLIFRALREDIGAGDLTSRAVISPTRRVRARMIAKAPGIVAGAQVARWVFEAVDRRIRCTVVRTDRKPVRRGDVIMRLGGPAQGILTAERTALNFLGHLSGIATLTHQFVQRVRGTSVKILDTRKTLPGLRDLEKYAVRVGGGSNHRRGLDDAVLIKTNHLKAISHLRRRRIRLRRKHSASSQVIQAAVRGARRKAGRTLVEIEVANLREFKAALHAKPDVIMLDNWPLANIRKAVAMRRRSPLLEVSGGVTLQNVRQIAKTGVDRIAVGRLTHSAPALDVALEVL